MLLKLCEILAWCTKTFGKDCNWRNSLVIQSLIFYVSKSRIKKFKVRSGLQLEQSIE